jgi:tetratricopeptide (TPR) repeat protein
MRRTILIACLFAATPSLADDKADKAKAKKLYEEGKTHYDLAEYKEAIAAWKQVYSLSKKPILLFNIAQAYRLSGDCNGAMAFYDSYTREEPAPKNQDELDQAVALCKDKVGKPAVVDTKPVDTKPVDTKPVDTKHVDTKPVDTKHVDTKPVDTKSTGTTKIADASQSEQTEEQVDTVAPASPGHTKKLAGIVTGAAGLVLGGVGMYFALDAKKQSDKLDGFTGEWMQPQKDIEAKGKSDQTKAYIFGGLGVGAVVVGGVLFVLGSKSGGESHVAVAPTHGGAAVGYTFSW